MSDIPVVPLRATCGSERVVRSVANLTRRDGEEFLAPRAGGRRCTRACATYPLERANEALADLRAGRFSGAAVVVP